MRCVLFSLSLLLALTLGGPAVTLAQDATPDVGTQAFPIPSDPAACQVTPRSTDELLALWYGPEGTPVLPEATPAVDEAATTDVTIPVGSPADGATTAAVVATMHELRSCFDAFDVPRGFALVTDDFIRRQAGPPPGMTREVAEAFLTQEPPGVIPVEETVPLLAVSEVSVLADGRVGALVTVADPVLGSNTNYTIFVRQGDRWLVDETIEFLVSDPSALEESPGTIVTPTP